MNGNFGLKIPNSNKNIYFFQSKFNKIRMLIWELYKFIIYKVISFFIITKFMFINIINLLSQVPQISIFNVDSDKIVFESSLSLIYLIFFINCDCSFSLLYIKL